MSARAAFSVLALCLVVAIGPLVTTGIAVALGGWVPAGPVVATPRPGPFQPGQPGGPRSGPGSVDYDAFLDDVRTGRVMDVMDVDGRLAVTTTDGGYEVFVTDPSLDVLADMEAAAAEGGVDVPAYGSDDGPQAGPPRTYEAFLDDVRGGRISDVVHEGDHLTVGGRNRTYEVTLPDGTIDVLRDIEEAAAAGGVSPPAYTKVPA